MLTTLDKLKAHWSAGRFVCLGLDPVIEMMPDSIRQDSDLASILAFNRSIIEETQDVVAAYKPNVAFFERYGSEGLRTLEATVQTIHQVAPDAVVIIDGKRGDIGSTNDGYVAAIFDRLGADATTLSPYLGRESLDPFAARKDKMSFVLCRTSNAGAGEFQDLVLEDGKRLFERVASQVANVWNESGNFGLVVGATSPEELREVREQVPQLPLLIPGVGAQGGDPAAVVRALKTNFPPNVLINSSRNILYASKGPNFAEAARFAAQELSGVLAQGLA